MYSIFYRWKFILFALACCWMATGASSKLRAQMTSVVNSLADDEDAYPWDDPNTENIDESIDGHCGDAQGRCTLRAALGEAASIGIPANVTFSVSGAIMLDYIRGPFQPPNGSQIKGNGQNISIHGQGGTYQLLMVLQDNIVVEGLNFAQAWDGILVGGKGNRIGGNTSEGNLFLGLKQNAIMLIGDSNFVRGNYIGIVRTDDTVGNKFGIFILGSYNTIGGDISTEANTISGNKVAGIAVTGFPEPGGIGNVIIGNFIGTGTLGHGTRGNGYGIELFHCGETHIGNDNGPEFSNVISGNKFSGVYLADSAADIVIEHNYIGTDFGGTTKLPNREGVLLGQLTEHCYVAFNNISGNTNAGVEILGGSDTSAGNWYSNYHEVYGNIITFNGIDGVLIGNRAENNIIGSSLTVDNYPNQIHRNGRAGVAVGSQSGLSIANQNTIRKNSFLDNGKQGIMITDNDLIVKPKLLSYQRINGTRQAVVVGSHDRPGSRIDFYTGEKSVSSHLEGKRWLGEGTMGTGTDFYLAVPVWNSRYLLATATDPAGNTSEFSDSLAVNTVRHRRVNRGANSVSMSGSGSSSPSSSIPGSTGSAYSWSGGSSPSMMRNAIRINSSGSYIAVDTLVSGVGYWIKCDSAATDSLTEFLQIEDTIDVVPGWNFIGSVSDPIPVSRIASIPDGMVTSQFFGYTTSYEVADTIRPGQAYWVNVSQSGSLILASLDSIPPSSLINIVPDTTQPPPPPPDVITSVENDEQPAKFFLGDAYPNPFNPTTSIEFGLAKSGFVTLKIYDLLGREVRVLVNEKLEPGSYKRILDARSLASGMYFYTLSAEGVIQTKKLLLLR